MRFRRIDALQPNAMLSVCSIEHSDRVAVGNAHDAAGENLMPSRPLRFNEVLRLRLSRSMTT